MMLIDIVTGNWFFRVIENSPFTLVDTPLLVPFSTIDAPGSLSLFALSLTLPLISL
jgi:hypothetical protein